MDKCLIFYGNNNDWTKIYNKESIKNKLKIIFKKTEIFEDINILKNFLKNEGQKYKNYILPMLVEHIVDLNNAGINNLFCVSSKNLDYLCNKKKFSDYINENKLSEYAPRIYSKWCDRNKDDLVVLKPPYSYLSNGVYIKSLREVQDSEFDQNAVQEYIKDKTEYAGYFVSYNGNITHSFAYESTYNKDVFIKHSGGKLDGVPQKKINLSDKLLRDVEKFLKPSYFTGTSCFDFKVINDKIKVFEINPRLGGSLKYDENEDDFITIVKKLIKIYDERNVYN